jgi:hypothetical protein
MSQMKTRIWTDRVYDLPYVAGRLHGSYLDLRVHRDRIHEIGELEHEPLLKPLVVMLNDPAHPFMTHASAFGTRRPGIVGFSDIPTPTRAEGAPCWVTSFVVFSFWYFDQNIRAHYDALFDSYPDVRQDSSICFELGPAYFLTHYERSLGGKRSDSNAVICTLWLSGWGSTHQEAHDRWAESIQDAVAFFCGTALPGDSAGKTISEHIAQ